MAMEATGWQVVRRILHFGNYSYLSFAFSDVNVRCVREICCGKVCFVHLSLCILPPRIGIPVRRTADLVHKRILREARPNRDPLYRMNVAMRSLGTAWFEKHLKVAFKKLHW